MTAEPWQRCEVRPTLRVIDSTERGSHATILRLSCGHDRSIGGNTIRDSWASGAAHMMTGMTYPCFDGHCGKRA